MATCTVDSRQKSDFSGGRTFLVDWATFPGYPFSRTWDNVYTDAVGWCPQAPWRHGNRSDLPGGRVPWGRRPDWFERLHL